MQVWILICCLLVGLTAAAQDAHFLAARTSAVAHHSAFAHGYLHGYDDGFHDGDIDLQLAHSGHSSDNLKRADKASGYRREFGEKHFYDAGFKQGYRVGYADALAGRTYRAVDEVQEVAVPPLLPGSVPSHEFDSGFATGYQSGQNQGVADARGGRAASTSAVCPMKLAGKAEFCTGYVRAYRMGYSDGYVNVARPEVAQSQAAK